MSAYQNGLDVIGFGWQDALSAVHGVGKGLLGVFGAGAAGEAIEDVYRKTGALPPKPPANAPAAQQAAYQQQVQAAMQVQVAQQQQQAQAFQASQAALAREQAARRAAEDRSRFWNTLLVGTALIGTGFLAWRVLTPKRAAPPAPAAAPVAGGTP